MCARDLVYRAGVKGLRWSETSKKTRTLVFRCARARAQVVMHQHLSLGSNQAMGRHPQIACVMGVCEVFGVKSYGVGVGVGVALGCYEWGYG